MMIEQILSQNQLQVSELLRQHHIPYSDVREGIRKAYQQYGDSFGIKLVNILASNGSISNFDDTTEPGPTAPPGSYTNDQGITVVPGAGSDKTSFWSVWSNILSYVGQTGQTYQNFMKDISGTSSEQQTYQYKGSNLTWLYIAGGVILLILILILIFKK